jgi:membrane-associated HD superfamily phosphohydrolase
VSPKEGLYFIFNVSYIGILAIHPSVSLCLYPLTTNLIIMRSYSFVNMAILLIILLRSLGTVVCYFLNKHLSKGFKSGISLSTISVSTTTILFYNAELQFYTLTISLIILTLSSL